jgi:hypothetical protein
MAGFWHHFKLPISFAAAWDASVLAINFDVGMVAGAISAISVALSGAVYMLLKAVGKAKAESYAEWLKAHGPDLEAQLALASSRQAENAARIAEIEAERRELRSELKEAKEFLFEMASAIAHDRGISVTRTTTTEMKPADADPGAKT